MKTSNQEIERKLQTAMTVQNLIDALSDCDPDAPVLFACDYGDYHHTTQALQVGNATQVARRRLAKSAYSQSGMELAEDRSDEWAWQCGDCEEVFPPELVKTCPSECTCGSANIRKVDVDGELVEDDTDDAPEVVVLSMEELE